MLKNLYTTLKILKKKVRLMLRFIAIIIAFIYSYPVLANDQLTIYSTSNINSNCSNFDDGYSVIDIVRELELNKDQTTYKIDSYGDIDIKSLFLDSLSSDVIVTNYSYKNFSNSLQLLENQLGKEVIIKEGDKKIKGKLLKVFPDNEFLVSTNIGYSSIIKGADIITFEENDITLTPYIKLSILPTNAKKFDLRTSYIINEISWYAKYKAIIEDKTKLRVIPYAVINNCTKNYFGKVKLDLIAGKPNKINNNLYMKSAIPIANSNINSSQDKMFEYYKYSLNGLQELDSFSSSSFRLLSDDILLNIEQLYQYDVDNNSNTVQALLNVKNQPNSDIIIPKGSISLYKDGEFIGEDNIQDINGLDNLSIKAGIVYDIKANPYIITDQINDKVRNIVKGIKFSNNKNEDVIVKVFLDRANLSNAQIVDSSETYTEVEGRVVFEIKVQAKTEKILTYKIAYNLK